MLVFFRNIPAKAKRYDLVRFAGSALKISWFKKKSVIESVKLVILHDLQPDTFEHHCVMEMQPEASVRKVIARLNRQLFMGRYIVVREYHRRVWHNDPRFNHKNKPEVERRVSDRRRTELEIVREEVAEFSSQKEFHRQFN